MARKPLSPADLDPLASAASPITEDPILGRDLDALRMRANQQPMVLSRRVQLRNAADGMLSDELSAMVKDRLRREQAMRDEAQAKADAEIAELESQYEAERASYDPVGRPRLGAPMPGQNGRFQFRARGDGTEAVVEADPAAAVNADFARWADEEPGSDRQRMYNPQGYAEAMTAREQERLARAAAEQEMYGVAEGPNWRENLTDEQLAAREARSEADRRQAENNKATRAKVQGTDSYKKYEAKQAKLEANRVQMQQNPFLTLGDPGLNEWQQFVLARGMLGPQAQVTDPNAVRATHNQQAMRLLERLGLGNFGPQQTPEGQAVADAAARKANPRAAGVRDIAGKNYESEEAQLEIDALAGQHDSGGWNTYSYDDERKLAERLQQPPYNMQPADAEEYAYRAAEKKRWFFLQGGGKAGSRSDATPAAPADPALPPATGGGRHPL